MLTPFTGIFSSRKALPRERAARIEAKAGASQMLTIHLMSESLTIEHLQAAMGRVLELDRHTSVTGHRFARIDFDFSKVRDLENPWSAHFAMLLLFAKQVDPRVTVSGLTGRLASFALLLRNSPEVRKLVGTSSTRRDPPSRAVRFSIGGEPERVDRYASAETHWHVLVSERRAEPQRLLIQSEEER